MIDDTAAEPGCAGDLAHLRLRQILAVTSLFQLLLMLLTWPLWIGTDAFPQVALLSSFAVVPDTVQCGLLLVQILSLMILAILGTGIVSGTGFRCGLNAAARPVVGIRLICGTALFSGLLLAAVNQQRLQPWYWLTLQCWLFAVLLEVRPAIKLIRLSVISIYWFSAVSRSSPQISESMTGQIVQVLLLTAGLKIPAGNPDLVNAVSWLLTAGEFLTGWLLLIRRFRRAGILCAMLLHLTLIVALSPVGLGHQSGVLVWNVMFLVLIPLLFRDLPETAAEGSTISSNLTLRQTRNRLLTAAILLLPLSGLCGFFDNWPSWQLYSPRPEIWKLYVRDGAVSELPDAVQPFVGQLIPFDDWRPVRIDRWSLAATGAPLYPEDRFQLALIEWLCGNLSKGDDVRVIIDAPVTFPFWQRTVTELRNREELRTMQGHYWLNAKIDRSSE